MLGAWGDEIWEYGRDPLEHKETMQALVQWVLDYRSSNNDRPVYPVLCMDVESYDSICVFYDTEEFLRISSSTFRLEYMRIVSVRVNEFLQDVNNYQGFHQPMVSYIAHHLKRTESTSSKEFGSLERLYMLELFIRYLNTFEGSQIDLSDGINSDNFTEWLKGLI